MRFRRIVPRHGASSIMASLAICVVMTTFAWGAGQAQGGGTAAPGVAETNGLSQPTPPGAERLAAPGPSLSDVAKARQFASYRKLPLSFVPNQGQTDPQVRFTSQGRGYTLYLTPDEAVLSLSRPSRPAKSLLPGERGTAAAVSSGVLRMKLAGAHATVQPTGAELLPGKTNYYLGNDSRQWLTHVPSYGRVSYSDVYPGVDLVYYGSNQQQLEYDFVVKAGADPRAIRLAFDLAGMSEEGKKASLSIDVNGDLLIHGANGDLRFRKPQVYQPAYTGGQSRRSLEGKYVLAQGNEVGFAVAGYDKRFPLVIDPTLSFSSFLGGSGDDTGKGIAIDSNGNIDVTGSTESLDFPQPGISHPTAGTGPAKAFVSQISAGGTLVFSTIIGGTGGDGASAIALDSLNNIFITGTTRSTDFPVTGSALQSHLHGTSDAFLANLSSVGVLNYATYGGGSGDEDGLAIYVDGSENIYVAGDTTTTNGNLVGNSGPLGFQTTYGGGASDGFLAKLNASDSVILSYLTYFGGSGTDAITAVTADTNGNAYVAGRTSSTNFPIANATNFFANYGGGAFDAFVAEIDPTGLTLMSSTYLGGPGDDEATGIALDPTYIADNTDPPGVVIGTQRDALRTGPKVHADYTLGAGGSVLYSPFNIYVTGSTDNPANFFQTPSATVTNQGGKDAFVVKLNFQPYVVLLDGENVTTPPGILYSNFFGGSGDDAANGILVDLSGNAYLVGTTNSANFPMVLPVQGTLGDSLGDAFLTRINPEGTAMVFSSYLGGNALDKGAAVAQDINSGTWLTGETSSTNFPTQNPFQATIGSGGASDAFVANLAGVSAIRNLPGFTTTVFPANDDNTVGASLGANFNSGLGLNFFGTTYTGLYVSNNGIVSFGESYGAYTPSGLTSPGLPPIIAPYWADVETSGTGNGLVTFGNATVNGHNAFGVDFFDVGYYYYSTNKLDTFQVVLIDRADVAPGDFDIEFNYGKIQWETGDASGGTNGLGGSSAHVGYTSGGSTPTNYELPGSGVNGAFLDGNTSTGLIYGGNGTVLGRLTYQVRAGQVVQGGTPTVTVSPANLYFQHNLNLQCPSKPLILSNTGAQALQITSVVATGSFAISGNTCGTSLAAGANCEIDVSFTAEAPVGLYNGSVTITDSAQNSPQVVPLSGQVYPPCLLNSNTTSQQILRSTPSATFNISDPQPSCHSTTTTMSCANNQQASCAFNPSIIQPGGATVLTVQNLNALTTDNFTFTAQGTDKTNTTSINLSVLLSDFNYTPSATTATVTAGQTANYVLTLTPVNGLTGTVNLACQGAPTGSTCSVSPSTVSLAQNAPVQVNVSVSTGSRSMAAPRGGAPRQGPGASLRLWLELASLLALLGLASWGALGTRRVRAQQPNLARLRLSGLVLAALALMLMAWAACGSGGGGSPLVGNNAVGTPAGTYALTVTGTFTNSSGQTTALSRTQSLSLQVQ